MFKLFNNGPQSAMEQAKDAIQQAREEQERLYREMQAEQRAAVWGMGGAQQKQAALSNLFPTPLQYAIQIGSAQVSYARPVLPITAAKIEELKQAESRMVQKQARVPDSINMITGWRAWRVRHVDGGLRLQALGQETIWEPKKKTEAVCVLCIGIAKYAHAAPQMRCNCGFWAFKSVDMLPEALVNQSHAQDACVVGSVDLWGRVVETENGFRAQYAYPKELWLLQDGMEDLSWIYGVPVRELSRK